MHVLIAGCGWLGCAIAGALLQRGDRVTGIRSHPDRAEMLRSQGITPLVLNLAEPDSIQQIPADVDAILALQSAEEASVPAYQRAYLDVNRTLLAAAGQIQLKALVYSASTGVFEQRDGSDVEETTIPEPESDTGRVLLAAERMILAASAEGIPSHLVRLSGLYGPGRMEIVDRVRRGLIAPGDQGDRWMNFCHQEDATAILIAALDRGRPGEIYHATDSLPMRRREVAEFVATRLGMKLPESAGGARSFGTHRRILGVRTLDALRLQLKWPSLREGLEPFLPPR